MHKSTSRGIDEVAGTLKKIYSGIVALLVVAGFVLTYFLKPLLLPIVLALLLSTLLRPVQNFLIFKLKLPQICAALLIVGFGLGLLGVGSYRLATPAQEWMERLPKESERLRDKFESLRSPISDMTGQFRDAAEQMATLSEQFQDAGSVETNKGCGRPIAKTSDESGDRRKSFHENHGRLRPRLCGYNSIHDSIICSVASLRASHES